jgi:hypothetical protein
MDLPTDLLLFTSELRMTYVIVNSSQATSELTNQDHHVIKTSSTFESR